MTLGVQAAVSPRPSGKQGNSIMADRKKTADRKKRPAHVPEENVYKRIHWLVIISYLAGIGAVAVLMMNAG